MIPREVVLMRRPLLALSTNCFGPLVLTLTRHVCRHLLLQPVSIRSAVGEYAGIPGVAGIFFGTRKVMPACSLSPRLYPEFFTNLKALLERYVSTPGLSLARRV